MKDLKDLYKRVVPPLSEFEKSMANYASAHIKFEKIIENTERILLSKANKHNVEEIKVEMRKKFALAKIVEKIDKKMDDRMVKIEEKINKVSVNFSELGANINKSIIDRVK